MVPRIGRPVVIGSRLASANHPKYKSVSPCITPDPTHVPRAPALHPAGVAAYQSKVSSSPLPDVPGPRPMGAWAQSVAAIKVANPKLMSRISAYLPAQHARSGGVDVARCDSEIEHDTVCARDLRRDRTRTYIVEIASGHLQRSEERRVGKECRSRGWP